MVVVVVVASVAAVLSLQCDLFSRRNSDRLGLVKYIFLVTLDRQKDQVDFQFHCDFIQLQFQFNSNDSPSSHYMSNFYSISNSKSVSNSISKSVSDSISDSNSDSDSDSDSDRISGRMTDSSGVVLGGLDRQKEKLAHIRNLMFAACGTSLYASQYGAKLMRDMGAVDTCFAQVTKKTKKILNNEKWKNKKTKTKKLLAPREMKIK